VIGGDERMEDRGLSLAEIQEVPKKSLMLLAGPPGAGKSSFCHQVVLNGLAMDKPVIFVTTEHGPSDVIGLLREKGLGEPTPGALNFVDAYSQTVGVATPDRPDAVYANCMDLNSISIATTKLQERMGQRGILLAFDSLTSPYLLSGAEVTRFMRLFLSKFAAEGNAVLALLDEGCGKPEDLVAMMSIADGAIRIETEKDRQLLNVVKHPKLGPTRIEVPLAPSVGLEARIFDPSVLREFVQAMATGGGTVVRREAGDCVNLFWPNFAHWSGMLWDPKRFPMMTYELNKEDAPTFMRLCKEDEAVKRAFPWRIRLVWRLLPKTFSKVKDMQKSSKFLQLYAKERTGVVEYLEDISKTDEHYFRIYECSDCWGFENIGAAMASYLPPVIAGMLKGFEGWKGLERDWSAVETKCIGLGDPYCEFKLVPGEISGLKGSLQKDSSVIERIHERLMDRLMGFLLHGNPLVERPKLGSDIQLHPVFHAMAFPALAGERYLMAQRMGGARSGKEVGERLVEAGLRGDEAVKRVLDFLEHCKVGEVSMEETVRIRDNCESCQTKVFATKIKEPSCYFTTGFLNGLFSAVKNQHVRETKCIAAGDPYCEWEII
jgi:predicted hydrocarbon binding protein/KaiC/GvpD/RAD55 family RecA-like ATPase